MEGQLAQSRCFDPISNDVADIVDWPSLING